MKPLTWRLLGIDENRWRIKLFSPKNPFKRIGEGSVKKKNFKIKANKKINNLNRHSQYLKLPNVKQNKSVVIDPGHGGPDPGAIGIKELGNQTLFLKFPK